MGRTIRIDDEVFAWLQQQGETFVDTPNSVLRRLAGLEHAADMEHERVAKHPAAPKAHTRRSAPRRPVQITGKQLNEEWSVGAKHALFHRNGRWYNNLERFPGCEKIVSMLRIPVAVHAGVVQLVGVPHADQIDGNTPAMSRKRRDDVAPEVGRRRVAVLQHDRGTTAHFDISHLFAFDGQSLPGQLIS